METGVRSIEYNMIDKLEKIGEKTGLVVNRKITRLGYLVIGATFVTLFGGWRLVKAFARGLTKE